MEEKWEVEGHNDCKTGENYVILGALGVIISLL